jgi:hypothetical protein
LTAGRNVVAEQDDAAQLALRQARTHPSGRAGTGEARGDELTDLDAQWNCGGWLRRLIAPRGTRSD